MIEQVTIIGTCKKAIFTGDTGYTISLFKIKSSKAEDAKDFVGSTIAAVGYYPPFEDGEEYVLEGIFTHHPKYGDQFKVENFKQKEIETADEVISFLSSGLFSGIGEKTATEIVNTIGEDCLEQIVNDPSCLMLVPRLTQKKATRIYHTLLNHQNSQDAMTFLYGLKLNPRIVMKIYTRFGDNTKEIIDQNPYLLIEEIDGFTFKVADEIAMKVGIEYNDERRLYQALVSCCVDECYKGGHTHLSKDQLVSACFKLLNNEIDSNRLEELLTDLIEVKDLILDNGRYYHPDFYLAEETIFTKLQVMLGNDGFKKTINQRDINNFLSIVEKDRKLKYSKNQIQAINNTLNSSISIVTGGPGTGKTTVIKGIVGLYMQLFGREATRPLALSDIALIAPTGRAAKRMSEQTLLPAATIHRFLKWDQPTNTFEYNENNKTRTKLVIVDEVSMLDIFLMENLLKALPNSCQIIFVGDDAQLPSVAPGNVLNDLINSNAINVTKLDVIYRQDSESSLIDFSHQIRKGQVPDDLTSKFTDRNFIECTKHQVKSLVEKIALSAKEKGYGYDDMQILVPMYRGVAGIDAINESLQEVFNPKQDAKRELSFGNIVYREQDKVLLLKNRPNDNVFNGDMGIIRVIKYAKMSDSKKNEIIVDFDGRLVTFYPQEFIELTHGYCISIHKSQGGEFKLVIMPVVSSYSRMLQKKLIYTGITRAKESLVLIGEKHAFIQGVENNYENIRQTGLSKKLEKLIV